jgi:serine/threonine protein kinase
VLPDEIAGDPDRLRRFRREARALAAINHPNIVTIHGVEDHGGRRVLIMERVEGKSLDRLLPSASGPSDVRVTAEVIQVSEDTALWTNSYQAVLADPFAVQSQIATHVPPAWTSPSSTSGSSC